MVWARSLEITRTDMKPYPSCRQTNAPVDLALELKRKHPIAPEDIREIKLVTYDYVLNCPWLIDTERVPFSPGGHAQYSLLRRRCFDGREAEP